MKNELVNNFLNDRRAFDKSKGTIKQYELALYEFVVFIESNYFKFNLTNIKKIEVSHIKSYLVHLTDIKKNEPTTKRRKISALKMFFKYYKSIGKISDNPIDYMESIKVKRKIPKYFELSDCKNILENVPQRNNLRNKTIISLFLNTGMRLSELTSLNVENIDKNNLTITGKGNKERTIFLSQNIQNILHTYINERPNVKTNALFVSERGNRIDKSTVQHMVQETLKNAGLKGKTHMFRHTYATQFYQSGLVDILQLQVLLGHSNIATTTIYTQVAKRKLQELSESNPLNALIVE